MGTYQVSIIDAFNELCDQQKRFQEQKPRASISKPPTDPSYGANPDLTSDPKESTREVLTLPSRPLDTGFIYLFFVQQLVVQDSAV